MKPLPKPLNILRRRACDCVIFCTVISCLMVSTVFAKPITYTGFTITDGSLGSWTFHNARVYLTFESDTRNVRFMQFPISATDPTQGTADINLNETGRASVTIISGSKVVHARFAPHQVFVSLDLGDTIDAPHVGGRGVGFGSFTATGIEPAYPLAIEDGTIDWGDIVGGTNHGTASAKLSTLSTDLVHNAGFSGRADSCVGFPKDCLPPNALKTDKGDLYLAEPYVDENSSDSLGAGFFLAQLTSGEDDEEQSSSPGIIMRRAANSSNESQTPISYHGYLISDVTLGGHRYHGAQVYLSFDADASTVVPFSSGSSLGFMNANGDAHVTVVSEGRTISADFTPGQIYVYYNVTNASVGFGSAAGNNGYPLSITGNMDFNGLVENSEVGAVSDLTLIGADASLYSPATATLATDLTNATTLSGAASSCVAFDPLTSTCSNLNPVPLKTNRGDFYLYEPYTDDETPVGGVGPFSVNWGVFWSDTQF